MRTRRDQSADLLLRTWVNAPIWRGECRDPLFFKSAQVGKHSWDVWETCKTSLQRTWAKGSCDPKENAQNIRIWASEPPHAGFSVQHPIHDGVGVEAGPR